MRGLLLLAGCALALAPALVLATADAWAAFDDAPLDFSGMRHWQVHLAAALVAGGWAAGRIDWRRPYLYALLITFALLIAAFGPLLACMLGLAARKKGAGVRPPLNDRFVCGIPLREACQRRGREVMDAPLAGRLQELDAAELEALLGSVVELEDAPLASLNRRFRGHPDTRVQLLGQACVAERLNRLDRHARALRARHEEDPGDIDAIHGLCEVQLAVLDQRLASPQELRSRAVAGLVWAGRLGQLETGTPLSAAFYTASFALHAGHRKTALEAWSRLADAIGDGAPAMPGDRFRLLAAEIAMLRGDIDCVREHVRRLEPDSPAKFWLQEFWLEPVSLATSS